MTRCRRARRVSRQFRALAGTDARFGRDRDRHRGLRFLACHVGLPPRRGDRPTGPRHPGDEADDAMGELAATAQLMARAALSLPRRPIWTRSSPRERSARATTLGGVRGGGHHGPAAGRGSAEAQRGAAASGPEDGGGGAAHRGHCPRFQQYAARHVGRPGHAGAPPRRGRDRAERRIPACRPPVARPRDCADQAHAGVRAAADAAAAADRSRRARARARRPDPAHVGAEHRAQPPACRWALGGTVRPAPARERAAQSLDQCARRHARGW